MIEASTSAIGSFMSSEFWQIVVPNSLSHLKLHQGKARNKTGFL
jgi:hypothetical protein